MGTMRASLVAPATRRTGRSLGRCSTALPVCLLLLAVLGAAGCKPDGYAQTLRITSETVNVTGLSARVEYLHDGDVVNSIHLIDGNGDGVIDGKAGPRQEGNWPAGWEWFDDMYADAVVGQTAIFFDGQKITVTQTNDYEFIVGEYECGGSD